MSARIWKTRRNKPVKLPQPKNWQPMTIYDKSAVIASRAEIDALLQKLWDDWTPTVFDDPGIVD